jgi:hypothetical protein
LAKRLTEKQKDEIIKSFQDGKTVEILSQNLNFNKLTIVRHLKKILGESKYKEFNTRNKSIDLINKNKEINLKKDLELELKKSNTKPISFETQNENIIETDFSPDSSFFEIPPLDCEVDSSTQKDLSSIPISEMNFPKIVYMIVDKKIELETKYLKDYPEWQFLSEDELSRKTIQIHNDIKVAKSLCKKEQKVIKVPNTNIFKIVAPFLLSKGISRIVSTDYLIAL